jgi:hypothetical protein
MSWRLLLQLQRDRYVTMLIEQREAEENEMKRREQSDLRETWALQKSQPKNQAPKRCEPIVPTSCGASALQRFNGEVRRALLALFVG